MIKDLFWCLFGVSELYVYTLADQHLNQAKVNAEQGRGNLFTSANLRWVGGHQLLTQLRSGTTSSGQAPRIDWNRVEADGSLLNITKHFKTPPSELTPELGKKSAIYVGEDRLWRWDLGDGSVSELTPHSNFRSREC